MVCVLMAIGGEEGKGSGGGEERGTRADGGGGGNILPSRRSSGTAESEAGNVSSEPALVSPGNVLESKLLDTLGGTAKLLMDDGLAMMPQVVS